MKDHDNAWRSPFGRIFIGSVVIAALAGFVVAAGGLNYLKRLASDDHNTANQFSIDGPAPAASKEMTDETPADVEESTDETFSEVEESPLQLMVSASDRQQLENGNELITISGHVINPTERELAIPTIYAELREKQTRILVHSWTIQPPATVLAARASTSFSSQQIEVSSGGDELTVSLGETTE